MPTDPQHTPTITQPSTSQPKKIQKPRKPKKNTKVPQPSGSTDNVADKVVYKELDDSLVRVATIASSLEAEQDSGGGPKRQETMGDTIAQTMFENVSKTSNDSLLAGVSTPQSDEDSMKLKELMEFCTKLQQRVLDLENTKTAQAQEITSLKLREDASNQGRKIDGIDKDAEITLVDETQGMYGDDLMFDTVSTADPVTTTGDVVTTASVEISTTSPTKTIITDDLTLTQTLIEIRSKAIMEEPEKPTKRKDQIRHDEEVAQRLQAQMQAELEEEDRLVRQREEEANIVS
ncbi:hypothetical protein Tco_0109457 [Tanacetum coccineum]